MELNKDGFAPNQVLTNEQIAHLRLKKAVNNAEVKEGESAAKPAKAIRKSNKQKLPSPPTNK